MSARVAAARAERTAREAMTNLGITIQERSPYGPGSEQDQPIGSRRIATATIATSNTMARITQITASA